MFKPEFLTKDDQKRRKIFGIFGRMENMFCFKSSFSWIKEGCVGFKDD